MADTTTQTKKLPPLSLTETSAFCSQTGMILRSGISTIEGITIMLEDAKSNSEKELLTVLNDTLMMTGSLYMALQETGAFPDYMVAMVQIGEQTGKLDEVMLSLADYYEKEASLSQLVKSAVTYPCVMILMMIAVILLLITKVMPVFNEVFKQMGTEMTGISRAILDIGVFLNTHWIIIVAIIVVLVLLAFYLLKTQHGQKVFQKISEQFNGTRLLSDRIASYRFANGLALTLSSGLTPEECLNLTAQLIPDGKFRTRLAECQEKVSQGEDLCESLLECGIFSGIYTRMAAIASRTGVMDEVMKKIADQQEEEIDSRISSILGAVEPTLVVILSVIVGLILLSVMLPLMSIMSAL
jgi:type IV pilus assembly protein PilC